MEDNMARLLIQAINKLREKKAKYENDERLLARVNELAEMSVNVSETAMENDSAAAYYALLITATLNLSVFHEMLNKVTATNAYDGILSLLDNIFNTLMFSVYIHDIHDETIDEALELFKQQMEYLKSKAMAKQDSNAKKRNKREESPDYAT